MKLIQDIIAACQEARCFWGIADGARSVFGDCGIVSANAMALLHSRYKVTLDAGYFVFDLSQDGDSDGQLEHTWLTVNGHIVDPTADQFFSLLDVDMVLDTPEIYIAHPRHDGDWLVERYKRTSSNSLHDLEGTDLADATGVAQQVDLQLISDLMEEQMRRSGGGR